MDKHTPEPWSWQQAEDIDDGFVFLLGPEHGLSGVMVPVQRKIEWDHGLDPDEDPRQFDEAAATADLIVAAPKLLRSCRVLLGMLEDAGAADTVGCAEARAAIAEAIGGDPAEAYRQLPPEPPSSPPSPPVRVSRTLGGAIPMPVCRRCGRAVGSRDELGGEGICKSCEGAAGR